MLTFVVWEGTQNPLARDQRQIQQRSPWTTASSVFIFCAAAESAAEDSRRPEQVWSFVFFVEVSYEAVCWAWMEPKKEEKLARRRRQIHQYDYFWRSFFCAVAESVLEGSNGWQQLRRLKKLTLRVTVLKQTERKQSDPTLTALSTIWPINYNLA